MKPINCEAAFPVSAQVDRNDNPVAYAERGMTLRDYFAAKALEGTWAHYGEDWKPEAMATTAVRCYQMADAMLRARE